LWSNRELRKVAPLFTGDIVNVSAWDDRDKEGGRYRDYFSSADSYTLTNYPGTRGLQGRDGELLLDLTAPLPAELRRRFDVVFNHTTLEHILDVRRAFGSLCELSRDVVVLVVPFLQAQHESDSYGDYWRFTPSCVRALFDDCSLEVVYESQIDRVHAACYLFFAASRDPERWREQMPAHQPIRIAGSMQGCSWRWRVHAALKRILVRRRGKDS
jgi:hypothetical protein